MKIELLRNCSHSGEIATYLATDGSGPKHIIKSSVTEKGIEHLRKEVRGWSWYQGLRYAAKEPICKITQERNKYLQIQIKLIEGCVPFYKKGLERNADAVHRVVRHYCDCWPRDSDLVPLHGDFSLGNVIMSSDGVHVIDWEHFTDNAVPWGFDVLNLLFETLFYGMRSGYETKMRGTTRAEPTAEEIRIIREQIGWMDQCHPLNVDMVRKPLRFLRDYAGSHDHLWGDQFGKFPVLSFTEEQIIEIDEKVRSDMK